MDFHKILSIAAKKQESLSKQTNEKVYTTQLSAPKKEKKEKSSKSDAVLKLMQEKEAEKKNKENEEKLRRIEEEKSKRFRIPKSGQEKKPASKDTENRKDKEKHIKKVTEEQKHSKKVTEEKNKNASKVSSSGSKPLSNGTGSAETTSDSKKKLSEAEKARVLKEFQEKVARMKQAVKRDKEDRIDFASGKLNYKKQKSSDAQDQTGVSASDKHSVSDKVSKTSSDKHKHVKHSKDSGTHKHGSGDQNKHSEDISKHSNSSGKHSKHKHNSKHSSEKHFKKSKDHNKDKKPSEDDLKHSKPSSSIDLKANGQDKSSKNKKHVKLKPRNLNASKVAPSLNFQDILKLAQEKSKEPVKIVPKAKKEEETRPMTQEEKDRLDRERARVTQVKGSQELNKSRDLENSKISKQKLTKSVEASKSQPNVNIHSRSANLSLKQDHRHGKEINKLNSSKSVSSLHNKSSTSIKSSSSKGTHSPVNGEMLRKQLTSNKINVPGKSKSSSLSDSRNSSPHTKTEDKTEKSKVQKNSSNKPIARSLSERMHMIDASKKRKLEQSGNSTAGLSENKKMKLSSKTGASDVKVLKKKINDDKKYDSVHEKVLVCGPSKPKVQSSKPANESSNPWDRIYGQIQKNNPKPVKRKPVELLSDSEDEYDEDMDGFIVGSDDDEDDYEDEELEFDYHSHIKQIFGYDRTKYKYESDYEIANMESNFRDQMKEEARSARLGLQEDLEDIRREEEELKLKALKKKKMKR